MRISDWSSDVCSSDLPDKPIRDYNKNELYDLLHKEPTKIKIDGINLTYTGLIPQIQKSYLSKDVDAMQPHIRAFVEIGRASCRERVCQYVSISLVAVPLKKNKKNTKV